jgi:AcrR family transcriptional regulator
MSAPPTTNRKGQRLGAKGDRMRLALMNATLQLLATERLWALKVSDIAAACGVRSPNFYAYFDSVEEVILALVDQAAQEQPDIASLIEQPWTPENARSLTRQAMLLAIEHWEKYRPVLKVLTMLADDGEEAFVRMRIAYFRPTVRAYGRLLEEAQADGRLRRDINTRLAAYSLAMRFQQAGASWNLTKLSGASEEELLDTMVTLHVAQIGGLRLYPGLESVGIS